MTSKTALRLAVDIGGTFTDTVLAEDGAIIATTKTPTTPGNPARGARDGVRRVLAGTGHHLGDVGGFIHGTTLATNALIERRGACVASVTTQGFRDILEIAYERRYSQYDIDLEKPDLIVPRARCFTVPERMTAGGEVVETLDDQAVDGLVAQFDASGAEAVAICLLHSYANPAHELRLRELIIQRRPDLVISLSCEVSPEAREFERLCTTIANAYIQPLMAHYLAEFEDLLIADGLRCPILMMTAGGGMASIATAARLPVRLVESGPAGGAILAAQVATRLGLDQVLSFDMGGTTAKLCLIDDFKPQTARKFEIARAERFIKGSGMPVRIPVLEMIEIGAGGGSIAGVDSLDRLTVGPRSAGSEPGPAAFGKGGTEATVSDADIVLGLIDSERFAEGRLKIDSGAAAAALESSVGTEMGFDALRSAQGVSRIVDESMASAARMHAVESGKDLGRRCMIAFGGNGPLHATRVARRAGIDSIVIPRDPGVASAVGFLHAPVSFELVRSSYMLLDALDVIRCNTLLAGMQNEGEAVVRTGAADAPLIVKRVAFMRYHGQGHEIEIALPERALEMSDVAVLRSEFEMEYARQFTRAVPDMAIEILNWAVQVSTPDPQEDQLGAVADTGAAVLLRQQSILCDVTGETCQAAVHLRAELVAGSSLAGPALIVEPQTTTFVSRDFSARVDAGGNLVLTRQRPEAPA